MKNKIKKLMGDPKIQKALAQIEAEAQWTVDRQLELCAIRSPSNNEGERAKRYFEMFQEIGFDECTMDEVGNVLGVMKGTGDGPTLMLSAHTDTVFDINTDCTPVTRDGLIWAPGIADDTRGMADVLAVARAMKHNGIRPQGTIIFCGDVGEETLGALRGMRHLFNTHQEIDGLVSIDGTGMGSITYNAVAGKKARITYTGTGGHALSMFGFPNANNALARAIAKIADIQVPVKPITIFNTGSSKAARASVQYLPRRWP